jgi:glycosyltransferase involved in cell wall biosynthesis
MQSSPKVSFIIPTFNRAYILDNAIQSILKQSYRKWEIVVVDDGSTDNTAELVKGYGHSNIKYLRQENRGPSAARNTALEVVSGDWVAYLDSDNELLANYLAVMTKAVGEHTAALYAFPKGKRTLELYENSKLIKSINDSNDFLEELTTKNIFMRDFHFDGNGFMHSRRIIDEGFRWDENLQLMEEWDFVMSFAEKYQENFLYVPQVLFRYHQRFGTDGLVSNATYEEWANAFEYIYNKHQHDSMLQGQMWYPSRVEKYRKLQVEYEQGETRSPHLRYFS